jgi:hypothetical protein
LVTFTEDVMVRLPDDAEQRTLEVRLATAAAPGRANEDYALAFGGLVAVFDGVTQPSGLDTGCVHGPAWYVRRLATRLCDAYSADSEATLSRLLADAIDVVRGDHGNGCDLANPGTPASTVCALKTSGDRAEYLVLCDSPLVLDTGAGLTVVADDRLSRTVAQIRERTLIPGGADGVVQAERLRAFTPEKYQHINRPAGYWIASVDPQAAFEALTGSVPLSGPGRLRRAVLLTDGASCAVDEYGLLDWAPLLDLVSTAGPAELIRQVRAVERADPQGVKHVRYKRHDDATVAVCRFREDQQ